MRAFKSIILVGLLFAGLAMPSRAQSVGDKIRYHWITENQVILWKSLTDADPVIATLDPNTLHWSVPISDATKFSWQSTIYGIIRLYRPQFDTTKPTSYEQLWGFVLTKLRNEYGTVAWAQSREPSAEIYLVPKDQGLVEVVVNSKVSGAAGGRVSAAFTQSGGKWSTKTQLPLENQLGISPQSTELHKILSISDRDRLPDGPKTWAETWDKWITNYLVSPTAVRPLMYEDAKGRPQWLWQERLKQGQSPPAASRQMPQAPSAIAEPELGDETNVGPKSGAPGQSNWLERVLEWVVVALVVLFALILAYYFGFRKGKKSAAASTATGQPALVTVETLEKLHTLVRKRLSAALQGVSGNSEGLLKVLEWVHGEYRAEAKSNGLLQDAKAQWDEHLRKFLQETVGVEEVEDKHLKKLVELGRSVEMTAQNANYGLMVPPEVKKQMGGSLATELSQEKLLAHWPKMVSAYDQCLLKRTTDYNTLEQRFNEENGKHDRAIKAKEKEVEDRWQGRVTALTTERNGLDQRCKKAEGDLQNSKQKIGDLEKTIKTLQDELRKTKEATEAAQGGLAPLEKKLDDIREVQILSSCLRKWLQGYFAAQMKDDSEIRPVAVVASLLNFSLNQMCFSVVKEQDQLRRVMAHNIFRLTRMFEQQSGGAANFKAVYKCITRIAPEVEETLNEIGKIEMKGDALDAALFQGFLNRLNTDTGKNLSPFFIEMDAGENKLVRVSVS